MTISPLQALANHAGKTPKGVAFISGDDVWTYEQLAAESERLAHGLAALGIKKGDRAVLHMLNRPEMLLAYYACFRIGAIVVPLRTAYKAAELSPILRRVQPSLYIGQADLYREVAAIDPSILPADGRFIVDVAAEAPGTQPWTRLFERSDGGQALTDPDLDAAAVLISTSGTTGIPKLVIHTQATLAANAEAWGMWDLHTSHVAIQALPMAHSSGLFSCAAFGRFGIPFVLIESFAPDAVLDAIERHHGTWLLAMPAAAVALLERQKVSPRKVDSLRFCVTGGDVCPLSLQREFPAVFGTPLRSVWAASEVAGLTYGLENGPVTRIVESTAVRLVDDAGVPVARGEVGELEMRGPYVSPGYWGGPGKIEGAPRDGWYRTGDMMRQGHGNDLWFVSRKKHLIIRGGTNISPAEVEQVLLAAHPSIEDAAVVGVPDEVLGERVAAYVQLAVDTRSVTPEEILATVRTQLADYKVPERLMIVKKIPRNALGKIDRDLLGSNPARERKQGSLAVQSGCDEMS
jgi:long-chain acyl-CoA synthetase